MSPRAAARLESLGFTKVYDYEAGKSDWLAAALPSGGRLAVEPSAGDVVRGDDIACHLGERPGDVAKRVRAAGRDICIVVNDRHVILGGIRGRALDGDPNALVDDVMQLGPSTIRPDTNLETVVSTLRGDNVKSTLVTDQEGRLIGTVYLEDVERKLAGTDDS
ncbi:MAG: CBS domain-containing protein [Chloroflexi bacterium]|nr:CBS domain-containing protein [Chloroflexota bacterium]